MGTGPYLVRPFDALSTHLFSSINVYIYGLWIFWSLIYRAAKKIPLLYPYLPVFFKLQRKLPHGVLSSCKVLLNRRGKNSMPVTITEEELSVRNYNLYENSYCLRKINSMLMKSRAFWPLKK
jgi:hypothetical protein